MGVGVRMRRGGVKGGASSLVLFSFGSGGSMSRFVKSYLERVLQLRTLAPTPQPRDSFRKIEPVDHLVTYGGGGGQCR